MVRRQAMRAQEEIPEDLLANIPVVGDDDNATVFVPVDEEVIAMPPPTQSPSAEPPIEMPPPADAPAAPNDGNALTLAAQLRYEMGDALARELDRAEQAIATAVADLENRVAALEAQVKEAEAKAEQEKAARERAERKLKAFQELARE